MNGVEIKRPDPQLVRTSEGHVLDHGALWEAVIYLNRRVMFLERQLEAEGD